MSFEVDVHKVGPESQSGDAITLRYGDFSHRDRFQVVVIDGGFLDTGEEVVAHIKKFYGTDKVDLVVSTHPDNDHSSGLRVILERLAVQQFWIHRLSTRKSRVGLLLEAATRTGGEARKRLVQASITTVIELEELADKYGIPIVEPFAGIHSADEVIYVLGPSEEFYADLFSKEDDRSLGRLILEAARKVRKLIKETWSTDALEEPDENATSARNNSSTILLAKLGPENHFLFTADAGVPGLSSAADYADAAGYDIAANVKYFQGPHHGSKRNVGPAILDRLLGPIVAEVTTNGKWAFISAAKEGEPKHPSKLATNAMIRRGVTVYATRGSTHWYHSSDVQREGWTGTITPVAFASQYEEEEG